MLAKLRARLGTALRKAAGSGSNVPSVHRFLDLDSRAFRDDPYGFYRVLREREPVHAYKPGIWFISRYADAVEVCTDVRFAHPIAAAPPDVAVEPLEFMRSNILVSRNPPDHTRLRKLFAEMLTRPVVDGWGPRIEALTDELLHRVRHQTTIDIVTALARPLPVTIISEMMGLPDHDRPMLTAWSDRLIAAMDIAPSAAALEDGKEAARNFNRYFRTRLEGRRRREHHEDTVSRLLEMQARDGLLTDDDVVANATLLFFTGHETTTSLISSATLLLLRHPEQLAKVRAEPALVPRAIEECLRYEPPLQWFGRMAVDDVTLGDRRIRRGDTVYVLIGAVNRDPEQFPDPERFDVTRAPNAHRTFGHGIHACLGQYLARVEGATAIGRLLLKFPGLRLDSTAPRWRSLAAFRGLESLRVRLQ